MTEAVVVEDWRGMKMKIRVRLDLAVNLEMGQINWA